MPAGFTDVLNAVQTSIQGLGLTFAEATVPVVLRKLPRAEQGLDAPPVILVCPDNKPEMVQPFATEDLFRVGYMVVVVIVLAGNRDFTDTNLDTLLTWREKIRRCFQGVNLPGTDVFFSEVLPEPPLDWAKLKNNYEYSALAFRFYQVEPRAN